MFEVFLKDFGEFFIKYHYIFVAVLIFLIVILIDVAYETKDKQKNKKTKMEKKGTFERYQVEEVDIKTLQKKSDQKNENTDNGDKDDPQM